jgi:hypothetical protein
VAGLQNRLRHMSARQRTQFLDLVQHVHEAAREAAPERADPSQPVYRLAPYRFEEAPCPDLYWRLK